MRYREILREFDKTTTNSLGRLISSDPKTIENFWAWFGKSKAVDKIGCPLMLFHGTTASFNKFDPAKSNSNTGTGVPGGAFVFTDNADVAGSYTINNPESSRWIAPGNTEEFLRIAKSGSFDDQIEYLSKYNRKEIEYKEGGNIMPVYLKILRPLVVNAKGYNWDDIYFQPKDYRQPEEFTTNEIAQYAMDNGYDAAIIRNVKDVGKGERHQGTVYYVFSPNQIKSVLGNRGAYDSSRDEVDEEAI